jgi:hypothetical protein
MRALATLLLLFGLTAIAGTGEAKGQPHHVTLLGPDWFGELVITDPELTSLMGLGYFIDVEQPVDEPIPAGRAYLMERTLSDVEGDPPFDRLLYMRDPEGGLGYVYYIETVNGAGPYDGQWYRVTEDGEQALMRAFESRNVRLTLASVGDSPEPSPGIQVGSILWPLSVVAGAVIGWWAGRRGQAPVTSSH